MKQPTTFLIIGAGGRGMGYSQFSQEQPDRMKVVGVAEPREGHRNLMVDKYALPSCNVFKDWKDAAEKPQMADAVIIATQDAMHTEPAIAFAEKGYAILLEKPMAPNEADCHRIIQVIHKTSVLFGVCHVLRYTRYTKALKSLVISGIIGDIVNIQHLEPVGYWHQAHSFVRGNWRNEKESSSMLLAKSCHDLDWILHIMGKACKTVSSFGSLKHFRKEERPNGAADRCLDCLVETSCPYSAKKIYLDAVGRGYIDWPVSVLALTPSVESITEALKNGPYGRCVYACDNDVVDNQVVNMSFDAGETASFTMVAFTEMANRKTRVFGTKGQIEGDGEEIVHYDFLTNEKNVIPTSSFVGSIVDGHGGGDYGLMDHFTRAVAENNQEIILSGPEESLLSHRMVFAAEKSRKERVFVDL